MRQEKRKQSKWIPILCVLAVMAAAVLVRLPAARLSGLSGETRDAYMSEEGLPYLTDPDSYYHARIVENDLTYGSLSASRAEDGRLWDTQSRYPEGRSAEYQKGIVYAAEAVWKVSRLFGGTVYSASFWLPAVMGALAAAAAFLLGYRISGTAGGLTAGILVSCASAFVARVLPGRFDTDMFSAVMDVLLILLLTEAMLADTIRKRVAAAAGFAITAVLYSWCWSVYALMFTVLTAAGGALYVIIRTIVLLCGRRKAQKAGETDEAVIYSSPRASLRERKDLQAWILSAGLMTVLLFASNGISFIRQFLRSLSWAGSMTESGALPNLLASVTELNRPVIFPADIKEWFVAYVPGKTLSVLNGIGGAAVAILCLGGIVILIVRMCRQNKPEAESCEENNRECKEHLHMYFCVLIMWLAGAWIASMQGIRFVQHLAVPAGILAGVCVGYAAGGILSVKKVPGGLKIAAVLVICAAAVSIPVMGSAEICRRNRPSVSDALAEGMDWIRDNAEDKDAVIASWWDLGYFYEYASGHPAFWDGGSQGGTRAILIAKALTSRDPVLSGRILQMMASYGDRPAEDLAEILGEKNAFAALWGTLMMPKQEAARMLQSRYGIPAEKAAGLAEMIRPEQTKEVYLVLSGDMLYKLGWIEYYADWDFESGGRTPAATVYSVMPDGSENMDSETEKARAFFADRAKETIWRLFFKADGGDVFAPAFETSDGVSQIQIWKVL